MIDSTPAKTGATDTKSASARLNAFLDTYVLPYPVKYLTNRLTILATLCLLIPLIAFANVQVFVLATNSYLNVMSVVVSSTVLLYSTMSEVRDKAAAERREAIAQLHQQMMDDQLAANTATLERIQEELRQHINAQLQEIQTILIDRLETSHADLSAMQQTIFEGAKAQDQELDTLKRLVETMSKPR